jgi:hypothetical protein
MKHVKHICEYETESFEITLQNALRELEVAAFEIVSVHVLSDSQAMNGSTHSAYIICEQHEPVTLPPPRQTETFTKGG